MQYRRLGRTGLEVSLVGLGTGGPSMLGQQSGMAFEDQYRLIHGALDLGVNLFDTAAVYRDSEELLGRALADVPRDQYVLATKCSPFARDEAKSLIGAEELVAQCDRSLTRLQVAYVDVYQMHVIPPDRYEEVVEKLFPTLEALRSAGKIRFTGITEVFTVDPGHEMLVMAARSGIWDTIMVKYGILNQDAEQDVLPLCIENDIGVLDMAAVRVKLARQEELKELVEDWTVRGMIAKDALPGDDPLGWLLDENTESLTSAAYKFAAAHPAVSSVLSGTANLEHLKQNIDAMHGPSLPAEHMQRLRDVFGGVLEGV